jgi:hypothetical protein
MGCSRYRWQHWLGVARMPDSSGKMHLRKKPLDGLVAHATFTPRPTGSGHGIDHHNMLRYQADGPAFSIVPVTGFFPTVDFLTRPCFQADGGL